MHFVTSGRLLYTKADDTHKQEWVERGEDWIAEPVLWTSGWFHLGQLVATADCELVKVDPTAFAAVAGTSKSLKMLTALYAKGFLDWLSKQGDDLSDIVQGDVMGVIVEDFLPPLGEARTVLGHAGKPRGDP
ncbi:unnamed protein product [Polarella glacialis]|uniref:Cyclic nucleotide-binding domain-containing protein n=2 Tax=Polarella glacialis TaxID=89957 RepID=A0A813E4H8_POLGL|nr:unnamed protein product [Polarella glacialis]